jgi:hypothetical protein
MTFVRHLAEADAADVEVAHVRSLAAALEATANDPALEFRSLLRSRDY